MDGGAGLQADERTAAASDDGVSSQLRRADVKLERVVMWCSILVDSVQETKSAWGRHDKIIGGFTGIERERSSHISMQCGPANFFAG